MNTQAKVALDKQKHPERYCPAKKCLWRIMQLKEDAHYVAGAIVPAVYELKADCLTGYCPRHKHLAQDIPPNRIDGSF